jgi:uncharacterized membrane protein
MKVKPAEGRTVRDPESMELLPPEGGIVRDNDPFWTRRVRDGDVEVIAEEAPEPKPAAATRAPAASSREA